MTAARPPGEPAVVSPPIGRRDVAAGAACVGLGMLLAAWPHLLWWPRLGEPVYIADHDDLLYLSVAGHAYFEHPARLSDPTLAGAAPSLYQELPLVPGIVVARALGIGPLGVDLVWRLWSGASIGLGFYLLARSGLGRPWLAAAVTAFVLTDSGLGSGHLGVRQATLAARLATGRVGSFFELAPPIFMLWRIITPGLSLGYLLLHAWLVRRARARPTPARLGLAGLGFGLLFYVYFYFWTAVGLALALAFLLDAGHRRVYFHAAWVGGLIGLPAVLASARLKRSTAPDWLPRSDMFLPIGRTRELLWPSLGLALLVVSLIWTWWRRRDLLHLWALGAAGLMLLNHQVVSGLQIQNFHWTYVWGPCLSFLVVVLAADEWARRGFRPAGAVRVLAGLLALHVGVGVWLRTAETLRSGESRGIMADYQAYRAQRLAPGSPRLEPGAVLAGDPRFVDFAVALEVQRPLEHYCVRLSPAVTDAEYGERIALNAVLLGVDRAAFASSQAQSLSAGWGPWVRDPNLRAATLNGRLAAFDAASRDPTAALDRFGVRHLALTSEAGPPPGSDWSRLQDGPTWTLWTRTARVAPPHAGSVRAVPPDAGG